jgi:hypothetical protein
MATKREQMISWLKEHGLMSIGTTVTCDDCPQIDNCKWAFDPYNINGDCLGDK